MVKGVVALIFYTFLTFGSLRFLRNMAYEAFLIGHIIMVAYVLLFFPPARHQLTIQKRLPNRRMASLASIQLLDLPWNHPVGT